MLAHLLHQSGNEFADEGLVEAEVGVAIAHCTAQDAANNIARLHIARQLTIGNGEGDGAEVVGNNPHCDVCLLILAIFLARQGSYLCDTCLEYIGIVVALLVLQHHTQALKAHTGVDVFVGQRLQRAVGLAVELHKHKVPNLNHKVVAHIDHLTTGFGSPLLLTAEVEVNLATRTARTRFAHLPEVVVLVAEDDVVLGQILFPIVVSLLVHRHALLGGTLKHGGVEPILGHTIDLGQQLPSPINGLLLEVVAKGPVAEHLEHCVVVGVVSNLLKVVVLTRHTQTLLGVGSAGILALGIAKEDVLKLVHTCVGKHQRGVVLYHHRSRGHDGVALALKEFQELCPDFVRSHHIYI